MRRLTPIFFILALAAWYAQNNPTSETWSITFLEWNQKSPAPIWSIFFVIAIISLMKKKKVYTPPQTLTIQRKPQKPVKQEKESPRVPHPNNETQDWRKELIQSSKNIHFPRGGKVEIDPQKDTAFMLKLPHKTHQSYKDSIDIFAQWLATIPVPKRILIRFDAGCSEKEQQLARAAFRKRFHINDMMIRKDANQIDILFHHPDQKWGRKYNLNKVFR